MTVIYAIVIFLLLIFIHEFGHFIAAKLCNVKVNEFALGMGPAIFKKQGKETLYALRIIPIGGYCAMEGEDEDSEDERALNKKSGWQKFFVFVAGATMNAVLALVIMIIIALVSGSATSTVGGVTEGLPAEAAGIKPGDTIVAIDDVPMKDWNQIISTISETDKEEITLTVDRDGVTEDIPVAVYYDKQEKRNKLGITTQVTHNPAKAVVNGAKGTWSMGVTMIKVIGQLFTGDVAVKELSGPVGIVTIVNETSKMGFIYVAYLTALISLNLAIMNLLPFPALDGGRVLFLVIRKITGRRVTDEMEGKFHFAGLILLFALMIYVTFNDIGRIIS